MQYDIQERTFSFGLQVIKLIGKIPETRVARVLSHQVLRSATSIGANVEEAQAAHTKNAFTYKMNIALSEARETHYWLRLIAESNIMNTEILSSPIKESGELKKILGAIVSKSRGTSKR